MNALNLIAAISLEAAAKRFRIFAYAGGKLNVNGFDTPIVVDLQTLQARPGYPVILDHTAKTEFTVGQVERIENDGRGVTISGPITGDHHAAVKNVLMQAAKGHRWEASIGATFDAAEAEFVEAGQARNVNGQTIEGPFILAQNALLRETSILPMGADPSTQVNLAAAAALNAKGQAMEPETKPAEPETFEAFCAGLGVKHDEAGEALMAILKAEYEAKTAPKEETNPAEAAAKLTIEAAASPNIQKRRDEEATEEKRIADIRAACRGNSEIIQAAIRNGWTPEKAKLTMYEQQERSKAPAQHSKSHDASCTLQALQGAMILRAGGTLDHPSYRSQRAHAMNVPSWLRAGLNDSQRNEIMEAAWQYRDLSLVDVAREALRLDRKDVPISRAEMIQAAFSGGSLTNIFTTNVNTQILAAYEEIDDSTGDWTQETEVADFKTNERPRMAKGPNLSKLPRGGTADDLDRSDVGESFKIARYAGIFTVDEQDVIDDAFNALADMPKEMGFAAARLRPDLVYAILLSNPTLAATGRELFNTTDGNKTGSAALASDKLTASIARMRLIQENGVNLNLQPSHLIVPPSLEDSSWALLQSQAIVLRGTTDTEKGELNPHKRRGLQLVSDSRLENGVTDPQTGTVYSGSASTWFLAAAMAHTILVAFRRGTGRSPQVRQFQLDKGKWGMGWDVNMDIGAKAMDWRGLQYQQSASL